MPEPEPRLLVRQGAPLLVGLHAAGLSRGDLHAQLRAQSIGDLAPVQAAVFERDGAVSVIPAGAPLDPRLLADVSGLPDPIDAAAHDRHAED